MTTMTQKDYFSSKRKRLLKKLEINKLGIVTRRIIIIEKYYMKGTTFQCNNYPELLYLWLLVSAKN